jgi:small subunit ribosomal protein S8
MVDPISDMLTRIRNAQAVKKPDVLIPLSKIKLEIAKVLKEEGFIEDVKKEEINSKKLIKINLKYFETGEPVIRGIQRISKPGCRIYTQRSKISKVLRGLGIAIISTSRGLMTDKEAKRRKLGGEVICKVW